MKKLPTPLQKGLGLYVFRQLYLKKTFKLTSSCGLGLSHTLSKLIIIKCIVQHNHSSFFHQNKNPTQDIQFYILIIIIIICMCLSYTCYIITRLMYNACFIVMQYCPYCNKRPQNKRYYIPIELNRWRHKRERVHRSILLIPSNAEATFIKTRMQTFLKTIQTLPCWYSLDNSQ